MNKQRKEGKPSFVKKLLHTKELPVLAIVIILCIVLSIATPAFLTSSNILTTLIGLSTDGIIAIAMTMILAMGGIDLSVGSVLGFSGMVTVYVAANTGNVWLGAVLGLAAALLCGIINGVFIAKVNLTPFIMTLAMMSIAKGSTMLLSSGRSITPRTDNALFKFIGQGFVGGVLPFLIVVLIVIAIVFALLFRYTAFFREVFYIGSNEKAARLSGINVTRTKIIVYTIASLMSGLCGVLSAARFGASTPTTGDGVEMTAISAAVIGGASLNGGEGSILGAVLGILLLNIVDNGLILLNVSVYGQDMISGLILLAAVTFDIVSSSRRGKK